jgi:predicted GNAT family N-acyltransferase
MQHREAHEEAPSSSASPWSSTVPREGAFDAGADERAANDEPSSAGPPASRVGSILPPPPPLPRYSLLPEAYDGATAEPFDGNADTGPLSIYRTSRSVARSLRQPQGEPAVPELVESEATASLPLPSVLPIAEAEDIQQIIESPPISERAPVSTWRPKQKYPSYAPPAPKTPESIPSRAFAIKALDTSVELVSAYRLRYQVFESLGYLRCKTRTSLEIDEYDRYAIPFGAINIHSGELVGTVRLITSSVQGFYARLIQRVLDAAGDDELRAHCMSPRKRLLPTLVSERVRERLDAYNTEGREIAEISREIVHPSSRGGGVARALMEFGLAYAMAWRNPLVMISCLPEHIPINAKYGYEKLPGTDLDHYDSVGQIANAMVCDTNRLPEPARTHVTMVVRAMQMGEVECILEQRPREEGRKKGTIWHFAENYYAEGELEALQRGGERDAVA